MVHKGFTFWNNLELGVYRLLGVNQFRKVILIFEKLRHLKDNRKNENYHPSHFDVLALEQYNGFILYNAFLHGVSLAFAGAYFILTLTFGVRNIVADVFMVVLSLLNIYCIVLQRANHLRIKGYCYRYYNRFSVNSNLYSKVLVQRIYAQEPQLLQTDYEVICRIRNAFEGQADCVLNAADINSLKRICDCIAPTPHKKSYRRTKEFTADGLIEKCNSISGPYTSLQMRVDWLQRKFGQSGRKMLDHTVIITEDAECELIYRKLIPEDTGYNLCFVSYLLYEIFTVAVDKVSTNGA